MADTKPYPNLPETSPIGQPLDWAWLRGVRSEWGVRPKPSPRGLTMMDIAVGSYGEVAEHPAHRSMAPRGADVDPDTPDMGYILNNKSDVWAVNVRELYEEAVARQWSATRDIPWNELQDLPDDIEHAMCQLCTSLTEVEMIAADLPAKWMWRMNHDFIEAKMFLCTQIMDETRHAEVFRKRALANGGGLLKSRAGPASLLRTIIEAKTYTQATALLHLLVVVDGVTDVHGAVGHMVPSGNSGAPSAAPPCGATTEGSGLVRVAAWGCGSDVRRPAASMRSRPADRHGGSECGRLRRPTGPGQRSRPKRPDLNGWAVGAREGRGCPKDWTSDSGGASVSTRT